jgi:hypothetical protein
MNIHVEFGLTRRDVMRAGVLFYRHYGLVWLRWLSGVFCILVGALSVLTSSKGFPWVALMTPYGVFILLTPWINAWAMSRRFFANPVPVTDVVYHFTDDDFFSRSNIGESRLNWDAFSRWLEDDSFFLLLMGRLNFIIIMKSGFGSRGDIDAFRLHLMHTLKSKYAGRR